MSALTSDIIDVVRVVEAVEGAKQRVPTPHRPGVTYFSLEDTWLFQARSDTKVCPLCQVYDDIGTFSGSYLRAIFPYLTILDENTIGGPAPDGTGLVHPNCRCLLIRKLEPKET